MTVAWRESVATDVAMTLTVEIIRLDRSSSGGRQGSHLALPGLAQASFRAGEPGRSRFCLLWQAAA